MSTQEIAHRTPQQALVAQVRSETFKEQVALALPPTLSPERFVRATVTALMQNPDIARAEQTSVIQAVIRCAQDGLIPDGREAALVLFGQKAQYMPMIGGYRKIAADHGWTLRTQVVYANDDFDYDLGLEVTLRHKPARPGSDRGPVIAAYAIASHKDGRREIKVMPVEDIEKARAVSRAATRGPWVDWYPAMCEKTVGRALFGELPLGDIDEDRLRIARFMAEAEQDPAGALYGRPADTRPLSAVPDPAPDVPASAAYDDDYVHEGEIIDHDPQPEPEPPAPAPAPARTGSRFTPPPSAGVDPTIAEAADRAADQPYPAGRSKGKTLRDVLDTDPNSIQWALANWKTEPMRSHLFAFARVYAPDLYQAAKAEEELA